MTRSKVHRRAHRLFFGAATSLVVASVLELGLHFAFGGAPKDSVRVLVACACAIILALAAPRQRRTSRGSRVLNICLGALIANGAVTVTAPWAAIFAGLAAALAVVGMVLQRFGGRGGAVLGLLSVVGLCTGLGAGLNQVDQADLQPAIHTWNQYHYVLGTKYYEEVGNHDLYLATLLADQDGKRHLSGVQKVRNMHTYKPLKRAAALDLADQRGVRARFSDARWKEFQHDWEVFYPLLPARMWPSILTDLGTNESPVWVVSYRWLVSLAPLSRSYLAGLAALQIPMYAGVLAAALWGFGLQNTLWLLLWTLLFFGNRGRMYGGLFSYDWFALVVVATALIARGGALAAPLVALGGLMRGFGGLLAIGPTVHWLHRLWKDRRLDPWSHRYLLALATTMVLLLLASLTAAHGVDAWVDWAEKIATHSRRISTGGRHLGLKVLFGEDWSVPGHTDDLSLRREIYARQAWAYHTAQALLIAWTAWVVRRRSRLDAALLGLIPAFALMVLSRYYYAAWGVLLFLGAAPEPSQSPTGSSAATGSTPRGSTAMRVAMFGIIALHDGLRHVAGTTPDSRHQWVNMALLGLFLVMLGSYSVADWRRSRRLR